MQDFDKYKKKFFSFVDDIKEKDRVVIISHANCLDGMASVVFMVEILRKKYPLIRPKIYFIAYGFGELDKMMEGFLKDRINKIIILDLNVDMDLIDEFNSLRDKFDVLFIDHHPVGPKLNIDEKVIKTHGRDCTSLTLFKFGDGIIDEHKWGELVCVASVSEFSHLKEENFKFMQKYYPSFKINNDSSIMPEVLKLNSLVIYYSKDSLKAYEIIMNKDIEKIEQIHEEVSAELEKCLKDFEENAERYFENNLYIYFFKSRFSLGSAVSTTLSVKHKGSTIVVFSDIENTPFVKVSARNNSDKLKYYMDDLIKTGIYGLDKAIGGGHAPASGGKFLKKDIKIFKKRVIGFVKSQIWI